MKKYINLVIYLFLYFGPPIIIYKVFGTAELAIMWLMFGWILVLGVVAYLEDENEKIS
jgi:hypothetical protein